jgi:hypothetical protein
MPDTGAPWNIPYVENADLVSDWPADSLLVANAVAAGLSAAGNPGIGSNVVQTVKTDTFSTASTSYVAITGMSVTITPTSNTSKILVMMDLGCGGITNGVFSVRLRRDSTVIYAGDAAGNRSLGLFAMMTYSNQGEGIHRYPAVFLDSPGTTSSVTYDLQVRLILNSAGAPTFLVNRGSSDSDALQHSRTASSITAIEVAP